MRAVDVVFEVARGALSSREKLLPYLDILASDDEKGVGEGDAERPEGVLYEKRTCQYAEINVKQRIHIYRLF